MNSAATAGAQATPGARAHKNQRFVVLVGNFPHSSIGSIGIAAVVDAVLSSKLASTAGLHLWLLATCAVQLSRLVYWYRFRQARAGNSALAPSPKVVRTLIALSGTCWAMLPLGLFPDNTTGQMFLSVVVVGVCASAVGSLALDSTSLILFVGLTLLPTGLRLALSGGSTGQPLAALGVLFFAYLMFTARNISRNYYRVAALRTINEAQQRSIEAGEEKFKAVFSNAPEPIWILKEGIIVDCNRAALKDSAMPLDSLLGQHLASFAPEYQPTRALSRAAFDQQMQAAEQSGSVTAFDWRVRFGHREFWREVRLSRTEVDRKSYWYCAWHDIEKRKRAEDAVQFQLYHDVLTGLPNRRALQRFFETARQQGAQTGAGLALAIVDLDDFKPINDNFGHQTGDNLLAELSGRLAKSLRASDFIARFGGDEFIVIFALSGPATAHEQLEAAAQRLMQATSGPFIIDGGKSMEVGYSMGCALFPAHGTEMDELLRKADAALYVAKAMRSSRIHWWHLWCEDDLLEGLTETLPAIGCAFSEPASQWLRSIAPLVQGWTDRYLATLDAAAEPGLTPPAAGAAAPDHARVASYLGTLLQPELARDVCQACAEHYGQTDAWRGLSAANSSAILIQFMTAVHREIGAMKLRSADKITLENLINERLSFAIRHQQSGFGSVQTALNRCLLQIQSNLLNWIELGDFNNHVVAELEKLDGIVAIAAGRPDEDNRYVTEYATEAAMRYLQGIVKAGIELKFGLEQSKAQPPTMRAWTTMTLQTAATYPGTLGLTVFKDLPVQFHFKSVAAVPITDRNGHMRLVYTLWGTHEGQFEGDAMRVWLYSLRHLIEQRFIYPENPHFSAAPLAVAERTQARTALYDGGLQMHVQPILDLRSGQVVAVEGLARMRLADGSLLPPGRFLKALAVNDLGTLFREGLRQCLTHLAAWDAAGVPLCLSINLPPAVLDHPNAVGWVRESLVQAGISPQRLSLEYLEDEESETSSRTRRVCFDALMGMGVQMVMDDLGAGYSSLNRLRRLPFRKVKIDRALASQLDDDQGDSRVFIGSLIKMAHDLGLEVVVEGLESAGAIATAGALGANWGQGFAIARPMPPGEFLRWLQQSAPGHALCPDTTPSVRQ